MKMSYLSQKILTKYRERPQLLSNFPNARKSLKPKLTGIILVKKSKTGSSMLKLQIRK